MCKEQGSGSSTRRTSCTSAEASGLSPSFPSRFVSFQKTKTKTKNQKDKAENRRQTQSSTAELAVTEGHGGREAEPAWRTTWRKLTLRRASHHPAEPVSTEVSPNAGLLGWGWAQSSVGFRVCSELLRSPRM